MNDFYSPGHFSSVHVSLLEPPSWVHLLHFLASSKKIIDINGTVIINYWFIVLHRPALSLHNEILSFKGHMKCYVYTYLSKYSCFLTIQTKSEVYF